MRIKELILDGFKSYPHRTVVSGWDDSFNAITGLNGSGKSNILDAICFVLGITTLHTIRAQNWQDLIYKRGQAGVTRASVTIVFDNKEKESSPVGYETHDELSVMRQINTSGAFKYLINGHRATQKNVLNLFQSVQLNINNPIFVIMQGKITKVLNIKPKETLSMIEEAAGTSMFEEKREKALQTMERKNRRLEEIHALREEEIKPKLSKLREEKRVFLEFQKVQTELEQVHRVVVAYEWVESNRALEQAQSRSQELTALRARLQAELEDRETQLATAERDYQTMKDRHDSQSQQSDEIKENESIKRELERDADRISTQLELTESSIAEGEGRIRELEKRISSFSNTDSLKELEALRDRSKLAHEKAQQSYDADTKALRDDRQLLQSLQTGVAGGAEGDEGSASSTGLLGKLGDARNALAALESTLAQLKMELEHKANQRESKQRDFTAAQGQAKGVIEHVQSVEAQVAGLQSELDSFRIPAEAQTAIQEFAAAKQQLAAIEKRRMILEDELYELKFDFDHSAVDAAHVFGKLGRLVKISPDHANAALALEVSAGGRLFHVVVSDESVAKALLDRGRLKQRVTLVPLSKIQTSELRPEKVSAAKAEAGASAEVNLALALIDTSDKRLNAAYKYAFGSTLIVDTSATAKKVTFSHVKARSVTYDGDTYEPSGTLSGGAARSSGAQLLQRVQALQSVLAEEAHMRNKLSGLQRLLDSTQTQRQAYDAKVQELNRKKHECNLLQQRLESLDASRLQAQLNALDEAIAQLSTRISETQAGIDSSRNQVRTLERDVAEFSNDRQGSIDRLRQRIEDQAASLQSAASQLESLFSEAATAQSALETELAGVDEARIHLEESQAAVASSREQLKEHRKALESKRERIASIDSFLQVQRERLQADHEELLSLSKSIRDAKETIHTVQTSLRDAAAETAAMEDTVARASATVNRISQEHQDVMADESLFGQPDTPYNFAALNMADIHARLKRLEGDQRKLSTKVNPRVIAMIDSHEKRDSDLSRMYDQVKKDKRDIYETVRRLEEHKRDALEKTFDIVTKEFGAIFEELLPGNSCCLEPVDGDVRNGLNMRVRLGSVWKESLTELSGGQRSLVALSLIMSLLRFKPAPLYILDEVDSALDLHHTENIGRLIKNKFSGAQFIIVSLKDGLFTNANVLFKAKFRDGTSVVERTALSDKRQRVN